MKISHGQFDIYDTFVITVFYADYMIQFITI